MKSQEQTARVKSQGDGCDGVGLQVGAVQCGSAGRGPHWRSGRVAATLGHTPPHPLPRAGALAM